MECSFLAIGRALIIVRSAATRDVVRRLCQIALGVFVNVAEIPRDKYHQ